MHNRDLKIANILITLADIPTGYTVAALQSLQVTTANILLYGNTARRIHNRIHITQAFIAGTKFQQSISAHSLKYERAGLR